MFIKGFKKPTAAFLRDTAGSFTIFTLMILAMMLILGGIAVDLMRFETYRARLQATLDRAVLAASDLDICREGPSHAGAVVEDYVSKAGYGDEISDVQVSSSDASCSVAAVASLEVNTIFMQMVSVDQLTTQAYSIAQEIVPQVEISLALDISSSMKRNLRMQRLIAAASEFVEVVLTSAAPDTTSINLVPYAGQVNPGPVMFDRLAGVRLAQPLIDVHGTPGDLTDDIPYPNPGSCLETPNDQMMSTTLPGSGLPQTPYFMVWPFDDTFGNWGWCPDDANAVVYASDSVSDLQSNIQQFRLYDGTGTHYAMKWSAALLDPSSRDAMSGLIPPNFSGRPLDHADDVLKVIVLMTDGGISQQFRPRDYFDPLNLSVILNWRQADRVTSLGRGRAQRQFNQICTRAKEAGIVVFTIAFEAPLSAYEQMVACASSPAHAYNVDGLEIETAFASIAGQISQLRLVN